MATIAKENAGVLVVLSEPISSEQLLAQITEQDGYAATKIKQWRQNGAGAQILADLGLSKLRVLGTKIVTPTRNAMCFINSEQ